MIDVASVQVFQGYKQKLNTPLRQMFWEPIQSEEFEEFGETHPKWLIEQALVVSPGPNNLERIKNLADHVLSRMFNRETLQVARDRELTIVTLVLIIVLCCSNTQLKREILVLRANTLGRAFI